MTSATPNPWDRRPGEPSKWFARFEQYRLLGPNRSYLAVYKAERIAAGKSGAVTRIPGSWDENAAAWEWRARVEAFDVAEVERHRGSFEAAFRQRVDDYNRQLVQACDATFGAGVQMLTLAVKRLAKVQSEDELALADVPAAVRAGATAINLALNQKAAALSVGELLEFIDKGGVGSAA